ncbi:MAG: DNA polymerase IV [Alteromonadaceae bacterium]|nr:MAG: DNA polymerase IV [Alteromonadaceae bacterium]
MNRKIIHCDADCFFAAIEMRDDPSLRHLPMAVGGHSDRRGVISTCNYAAREYGVHSAMASAHALRLCPDLVIVPGNMDKYRDAAQVMRDIFHDYTDLVEPLSLDEAFLDVSACEQHHGSATLIAQEIRQRIFDSIQITVSAGVANCKFLAKIASDWRKPDGLFVVHPNEAAEFVKTLPVKKLNGVGKVTANKLHTLNIHTCGDILQWTLLELNQHFGSFGKRLYELARGIDTRPVKPNRIRKSLSVEHTYPNDLPNLLSCKNQLPDLLVELRRRVSKLDDKYRVSKAFVKVKFNDFSSTTLERVGTAARISDYQQMLEQALERSQLPVRLLGIGVRFFNIDADDAPTQLELFPNVPP